MEINIMASREIIFEGIPGSRVSGRELHCTVSDNNCVDWQVVPIGEQGRGLPLEDLHTAELFVQGLARSLGFRSRLEVTTSSAELPT